MLNIWKKLSERFTGSFALFALLTILTFCQSSEAQTPTWKNDAQGRPAPPCMLLDAATGISTPCSASNPIPTSGGASGQGTTSGTSSTGFGQGWFPSALTGTEMALFIDDVQVAFFRRDVGCGNCLQVAVSSDGGVTGSFISTAANIGNSLGAAYRVSGASTPRYLVANVISDRVFQSASLTSGWTAIPEITFGPNFPIVSFLANPTGSTTLVLINRSAAGGLRACRSVNAGITFPSCVDFATVGYGGNANGGLAYAGGTIWLTHNNIGEIWRSTDDGLSWVLAVATGAQGRSIRCFPGTAICIYSGADGNIRRSTDAGATWPSIVESGIGTGSGLCTDYGDSSAGLLSATPPIGLATIATTPRSSFNLGAGWFPGRVNGSPWDGTGTPRLGSFDCRAGRGIATYLTTGGGINVFALYNPITSPGGTLTSSAGGYNVSAPIQAGIILNTTPVVSAANAAAVVTVTNTTGSRVCIRRVELFNTGAAGNFTLTITDGAVVVLNVGTIVLAAPPQSSFVREGSPLVCSQTNNNLVVNIGAGGAGAISTTSVIADRYPN